MTVVTAFPSRIREIETLWIPLADGFRLAARIWLPEDAEQNPVPAILEYIPYRRRDGTASGDDQHPSLFRRPRLCRIRVDMRGTGDSDGLILDEYLPQEQDDGGRGHRLDRAPALVHRQGRHDRASRGAASTRCRSRRAGRRR